MSEHGDNDASTGRPFGRSRRGRLWDDRVPEQRGRLLESTATTVDGIRVHPTCYVPDHILVSTLADVATRQEILGRVASELGWTLTLDEKFTTTPLDEPDAVRQERVRRYPWATGALGVATQFICMLEGAVALAGLPGAHARFLPQ